MGSAPVGGHCSISAVSLGAGDAGQYAFGVARPLPVYAVIDPRVDPDWTFAGLAPRTDDDLHCYTAVFTDDQRGVQHELVHPWAPRTIARV